MLGLNGSGKTTLLRLLAGLEPPDSGRVSSCAAPRWRSSRRGRPAAGRHRPATWCCTASATPNTPGPSDSAVRGVLDGLGLPRHRPGQPASAACPAASGAGWRWARPWSPTRDLLLLDEPTNHLDIEAIAWLAESCWPGRGAVVAVTHDRWFLDAMATTHLGGGRRRGARPRGRLLGLGFRPRRAAAAGPGRRGPSKEPGAQGAGLAAARSAGPHVANRGTGSRPPRRSSPTSPSRGTPWSCTRLPRAGSARTCWSSTGRHGDGAAVDGAERTLLDDVTWLVGPGDRIGVVGINGSGKSTLLRILVGEHAGRRGLVRIGLDGADRLPVAGGRRSCRRSCGCWRRSPQIAGVVDLGGKQLTAGQLAERFGFTTTTSGPGSPSCPAASGGGCSCCGS